MVSSIGFEDVHIISYLSLGCWIGDVALRGKFAVAASAFCAADLFEGLAVLHGGVDGCKTLWAHALLALASVLSESTDRPDVFLI